MAGLDIYDNGNGSIVVSWRTQAGLQGASGFADSFAPVDAPGTVDEGTLSFNVYVNGVLNQNVGTNRATIAGLAGASYNAGVVPPAGANGPRPESLQPIGQITDAQTYRIKVVPVVNGVEVAAAMDGVVTAGPTSVMLKTPMPRGRFAFPNTPGGY